jgi:hypothetical protein
MMYLPMTSEENGNAVSERIFACSRPVSIRDPNDVSIRYARIIKHPTADAWAMPISDETDIHVHEQADEHIFDDLLDAHIAAGIVTEDEKADLQQAILLAKGERLVIFDVFPEYWRVNAKDHQTMIDEGWFPSEEN